MPPELTDEEATSLNCGAATMVALTEGAAFERAGERSVIRAAVVPTA